MDLATVMAAIALTMPAPHPMPVIHENTPCPGLESAQFYKVEGCYYPGGDIYLDPSISSAPTREHELGHAVDYLNVDQGERNRILRVFRWSQWRPEAFASVYAGCRLGLDPSDPFHRANHIYRGLKAKRVPAACRLLARAAG